MHKRKWYKVSARSGDASDDSDVLQRSGLVDDLVHIALEKIMDNVTEVVAEPHHQSYKPIAPIHKKRKHEMKFKRIVSTIRTLQLAYVKLLHETFENEWSSDRNLPTLPREPKRS